MTYILQTWNVYTNSWYNKLTFKTRKDAELWAHDDNLGVPAECRSINRVIKQ